MIMVPLNRTTTKLYSQHLLAKGDELYFPYNNNNNLPLMLLDGTKPCVSLSGRQALTLLKSDELEMTMSLLDNNNYNLSKQVKELLLWQYHLGHAGFIWIQELVNKQKDEVGQRSNPPILPTKMAGTFKCTLPKCPACQLSKRH